MQAREKLYDVYGEKSLTQRQCQNWFACFRSGDFDVKDAPRSGRSIFFLFGRDSTINEKFFLDPSNYRIKW